MRCGKCESEFETLDFRCTAVDRCTGCKGLWFDLLEKEDMLRLTHLLQTLKSNL